MPQFLNVKSQIFSKALGFVYFCAFGSLLLQVSGLFGSQGIVPVAAEVQKLSHLDFFEKLFYKPSLLWFFNSDFALKFFIVFGLVLSLTLIFEVLEIQSHHIYKAIAIFVLFRIYLSFYNFGAPFLNFQWDILLLETSFMSSIYYFFYENLFCRRINIWLFRVLLFKLMLMSGLVKLTSHDHAWFDLSALNFHYYTQPLPNFSAFFVHQLPELFDKFSCFLMFVIELVLPFFIFFGSRFRTIAAYGFIALQLLIIFTGNYGFFNLLAIALCIWLWGDKEDDNSSAKMITSKVFCVLWFVFYSFIALNLILFRSPLPKSWIKIPSQISSNYLQKFHQFALNSPYGLFAVMTTKRYEIVIQGANDLPNQFGKTEWQSYDFHFKPGALKKLPPQIAPYHPRLDWQMWFAALSNYKNNPWFLSLVECLLKAKPCVLKLLKINPFPGKAPKYIRALAYEYKFTDLETYFRTGKVWQREYVGVYLPSISLKSRN